MDKFLSVDSTGIKSSMKYKTKEKVSGREEGILFERESDHF